MSNNTKVVNFSRRLVDNLAEKVDECLLNRGRHVLLACNWDHEKSPLYRSGVSTILKCMEKRLAFSEMSVIYWLSAVEWYPLSRCCRKSDPGLYRSAPGSAPG